MINNKLPIDCIKYIDSFIGCYSKIFLTSKYFYKINRDCKIINYKDLKICYVHCKDKDLLNAINIITFILNKNDSQIIKKNKIQYKYAFNSCIHFISSKARKIATPYFNSYNISHFCCQGQGIVFKDSKEHKFKDCMDLYLF